MEECAGGPARPVYLSILLSRRRSERGARRCRSETGFGTVDRLFRRRIAQPLASHLALLKMESLDRDRDTRSSSRGSRRGTKPRINTSIPSHPNAHQGRRPTTLHRPDPKRIQGAKGLWRGLVLWRERGSEGVLITLALLSSCWYDMIIGLVLSLDVSTGVGSLGRKPLDFLSSHCGTVACRTVRYQGSQGESSPRCSTSVVRYRT